MSQIELFQELPEFEPGSQATFRGPQNPLWTENKAELIATYLKFFVFITKHGAYIDGFTGPQDPTKLNTWAAKLVLETEPRWLRSFYLCEESKRKIALIKKLVSEQPDTRKRTIDVHHGDFNRVIDDVLKHPGLGQNVASFCLLDQHTFECHWSTILKLAKHKRENKIELFYFLGTGWMDRAISGIRDSQKLLDWWGGQGWSELKGRDAHARSDLLCERFKNELGYKHVLGWPIHERKKGGGRIMYYMVHASDHDQAPGLMARAYRRVTGIAPNEEQLEFESLLAENTSEVPSVAYPP